MLFLWSQYSQKHRKLVRPLGRVWLKSHGRSVYIRRLETFAWKTNTNVTILRRRSVFLLGNHYRVGTRVRHPLVENHCRKCHARWCRASSRIWSILSGAPFRFVILRFGRSTLIGKNANAYDVSSKVNFFIQTWNPWGCIRTPCAPHSEYLRGKVIYTSCKYQLVTNKSHAVNYGSNSKCEYQLRVASTSHICIVIQGGGRGKRQHSVERSSVCYFREGTTSANSRPRHWVIGRPCPGCVASWQLSETLGKQRRCTVISRWHTASISLLASGLLC